MPQCRACHILHSEALKLDLAGGASQSTSCLFGKASIMSFALSALGRSSKPHFFANARSFSPAASDAAKRVRKSVRMCTEDLRINGMSACTLAHCTKSSKVCMISLETGLQLYTPFTLRISRPANRRPPTLRTRATIIPFRT